MRNANTGFDQTLMLARFCIREDIQTTLGVRENPFFNHPAQHGTRDLLIRQIAGTQRSSPSDQFQDCRFLSLHRAT